jgi:ABC-type branched-subunit amino acid transport system substrate-binding protein
MKRRTAVARISMTALPFVGAMGLPSDARADKDIVLAQSAVLSGPLSPAGIGHNQGALLAFSQLNSLGGIGGNSVRLVALDNGYDPAKTVETCKKLLRDVAPLAFFGTTGTPTTAAAIPVLREEGVALVGGAGVSDSV